VYPAGVSNAIVSAAGGMNFQNAPRLNMSVERYVSRCLHLCRVSLTFDTEHDLIPQRQSLGVRSAPACIGIAKHFTPALSIGAAAGLPGTPG
jgi:hypothetical protein